MAMPSQLQKEASPDQQTGTAFTSYAAGTAGIDQVSGITDSEPSPKDMRHEQLNLKMASPESMITALCAQVQALSVQSQHTVALPPNTRDPPQHQGKCQDTRSSPRKSKRTLDQTADSDADEGSQQSAPQTEDCLTVWDDYPSYKHNK